MADIGYNPLPYQERFHNSEKPKVYLSGGYACLPGEASIFTIDGEMPISNIKSPTILKSFRDDKIVWSYSTKSFSVGEKKIFKISHDYGELLVSESHKIFSSEGNYLPVEFLLDQQIFYLPSCFYSPLQTIAEFFQSELLLNAQHLTETIEDLKCRYSIYCHQYDRLLRLAKESVQDVSQVLGDVLKSDQYFYSETFSRMDDLSELELKHSRPDQWIPQIYKSHFYDRTAHLAIAEEDHTPSLSPEYILQVNQVFLKFLWMKSFRHKEDVFSLDFLPSEFDPALIFSCFTNTKTRVNKIEEIGFRECFDLHVPIANNYLSNNLIHHNCGKTYSLCMKLFELMNINQGLAGGLLCPNLKMFKKDVLPTIREICDLNEIDYYYHQTDHYFEFYDTDSTIYVFHAEDNGFSIRGPNLAFGLINEVTLCSKDAFDAFMARIRLKKAKRLQLAMSGTPEGFSNWAYEYFIENPREDTDLIFGDTKLNKYIADGYVQSLQDSYDKVLYEQFVEGKFVNITGNRAAYAFNRFRHLSENIEYNPILETWVSIDFNVDPMSATLWNRSDLGKTTLLEAFDEICLPNSNTNQLAQVLKERLNYDLTNVVLFPDPAGNSRSTRSDHSDIDILKQAGFKDIRFKNRIPSVRECLNAMNNLFDKNKILIHGKKCKNLIADLEQCILKSGGTEIDKSNPKRSHWLDGLKNMIDYEFPIRSRPNSRELKIR